MPYSVASAPPEILAQIFGFAIPRMNDIVEYRGEPLPDDLTSVTSTKTPPWPFLLVCRHWKDVVLSSPALWSTFVVILKTIDNPAIGNNIAHQKSVLYFHRLPFLFDKHLQRSKGLPLKLMIHLSAFNSSPGNLMEPLHILFKMAMEHRHRWEDVDFRVFMPDRHYTARDSETNAPKDFSVNLRIADMPMLRQLNIEFFLGHSEQGLRSIEFAPSARLEAIKIGNSWDIMFPARSSEDNSRSFPSLRSVVLEPGNSRAYATGWTLLQQSPAVERLRIQCCPWRWQEVPAVPSTELPSLQSLRLIMDIDNAFRVLRNVSCRSLTHLDLISTAISLSDEHLVELTDFLKDTRLIDLKLTVSEILSFSMDKFQAFLHAQEDMCSLDFRMGSDSGRCRGSILIAALWGAFQNLSGVNTFLPSLVSLHLYPGLFSFRNEDDAFNTRCLIVTLHKKYNAGFLLAMTCGHATIQDPTMEKAKEKVEKEKEGFLLKEPALLDCLTENLKFVVNDRVWDAEHVQHQ